MQDTSIHRRMHIPIRHIIHHLSALFPMILARIFRYRTLFLKMLRHICPGTNHSERVRLRLSRTPGRARGNRSFWRLFCGRSVAVTRSAWIKLCRSCGPVRRPRTPSRGFVRFWGSVRDDTLKPFGTPARDLGDIHILLPPKKVSLIHETNNTVINPSRETVSRQCGDPILRSGSQS